MTVVVLACVTLALSYALARQLGHPRGWVGRRMMGAALNQTNRTMLDAGLESLAAGRGERIADIGFGGGYALDRIREQVSPARPIGVEISAVMIEAARERWDDAVELHTADVSALPFPDGSLDGVLTVNTIYFWPDPAAAVKEIRRVLRRDGRLVLGMRRSGVMRLSPVTWFGFRLHSIGAVEMFMREAGFAVSVREKVKGEPMIIGQAV